MMMMMTMMMMVMITVVVVIDVLMVVIDNDVDYDEQGTVRVRANDGIQVSGQVKCLYKTSRGVCTGDPELIPPESSCLSSRNLGESWRYTKICQCFLAGLKIMR